jgi:hypothetical protein
MAKKNATAIATPTKCPITRAQFTKAATPLSVRIGDRDLVAGVKNPFSTGSFGWSVGNEKLVIKIDGVPCKVQVGLNLTVVGSKELPD